MNELQRLWYGEMPLERAFWVYAVVVGLPINIVTSVLFLILVTADWPLAALAAGYGLSVPYNIVVTLAVLRAAKRYEGDRDWANLARIVTVVGMIILTLT